MHFITLLLAFPDSVIHIVFDNPFAVTADYVRPLAICKYPDV